MISHWRRNWPWWKISTPAGAARLATRFARQPNLLNLDEILAERGYTSDARTAVQIAPLETVLARAEANPVYTVTLSETFDESWFDLYCQAEQVSPQAAEGRRGILRRIGPRTGFALLQAAGQPVP